MATITTDRAINPSQLAHELVDAVGGVRPLHIIGPRPDGTTTVDAPGTGAANITAAVDAHQADPDWTDPNPPPLEPGEQRRRDLRAKARAGTLTQADVLEVVRLALADGRL